MSTTKLEEYLNRFSEADWKTAVNSLLPSVHKVDRNALQIWFKFYPLALERHIAASEDLEKTLQGFAMQGIYDLKDQIDVSHHFIYGHRYWKTVKAAIEAETVTFEDANIDLAVEIKQIAAMIGEKVKADASLLTAITAVGLMTLNQVGLEAFKAASGDVKQPSGLMAKSPDAIVAERAKDDSQGLFGFLRSIDKKFSVAFSGETVPTGKFAVTYDQELTQAAAADRSQDWQAHDERCWDGVIPVECTAASCGTCWIGVIAGEEKLSEVQRRERRQMKVFGYDQPEEAKPMLRLACQTKAYGNATIVIPPWNGVFGKKVYGNVEHVELEPATTSAKKLRETIASAITEEQ